MASLLETLFRVGMRYASSKLRNSNYDGGYGSGGDLPPISLVWHAVEDHNVADFIRHGPDVTTPDAFIKFLASSPPNGPRYISDIERQWREFARKHPGCMIFVQPGD